MATDAAPTAPEVSHMTTANLRSSDEQENRRARRSDDCGNCAKTHEERADVTKAGVVIK
eukprot:CAMPEP_0115568160 /NCGR_PEP_ID=MMETSP0271-20121206/104511_1 /TAXON_ID=71861 /ORGANISM="Scrippsiella trochoidea, Strain CCMP3099" /LENGTH=58 /DNA_ID=CAMNT_0003002599 /DNA_START=276 /DNA_END=453 /DNA_ORIENTATION=+